jgi:hypothetical protein
MTKTTPKGVLTSKLADRALHGRARLYHWLRLNYDELVIAKSQLRYTWKDLAITAAEAGARDATGMPPKPDSVRKAWQRVEIDRAKTGVSHSAVDDIAMTKMPANDPTSRSHSLHAMPAPARPADAAPSDEPPIRFTFRPSRPR